MDAKLTLKLNKAVIERAKKYASSHNKSFSRLIASYLKSLTHTDPEADIEISPFVKSLCSGVKIPTDLDSKKEYGDYLAEKYK